jgi:hypothetical protein
MHAACQDSAKLLEVNQTVTSRECPMKRSHELALRLEAGAEALRAYAETLNASEWSLEVPRDGRTVGVVIHHVASMYPLEMHLAGLLAAGKAIEGVTWDDVHALNASHASQHAGVGVADALEILSSNSRAAAASVRALTDAELDSAAPVSLNADAPLTCQFFVEDHALRHSYHHLAKIRGAVDTARAGARHVA